MLRSKGFSRLKGSWRLKGSLSLVASLGLVSAASLGFVSLAHAEAAEEEEAEEEPAEEEAEEEPAEEAEEEEAEEEAEEEEAEEAEEEAEEEAQEEQAEEEGPPPPPSPRTRPNTRTPPTPARPTRTTRPTTRTNRAARNQPKSVEPQLPGEAETPPNTMEAIAQEVEVPYRPKPGGHLIKFNLEDANLAELVNHISGLTGKRFIYGAKVRQIKVTVVSPTPVTLNEAYEAFLSILNANGMTVVPHGRFLKIVDSGGVVTQTTPILARGEPVPYTDRIITRLYRLQHADAGEVSKILAKFKSKEGDVTTFEQSNLLIITDSGANVRRMIRLIEEVDVGGTASKMWIEPVHYGDASELAKQLNEIYDLGKGGGGSSGLDRIIGEEQTNSLIVIGNEDSYLRLLELLKRVDIAPAAEGRIHVLPLQHANSQELAKTLTAMLGAEQKKGKKGAAPGAPEATMFEGDVQITEDKATNSLVISSSPRDFAQLRLVIEQLDMKRRQVFLEAVIMDVSVDRSSRLGIAYHGATTTDIVGGEDSLILGGFNPINSVAPSADQLQALALGVRGPEVDGDQQLPGLPAGVSVPAFGVFLNALAESGDSNVLSTPHIIAMDNTEAEINVGENVPLQQNIAGGFNPSQLAQAGGAQGAGALGALGGLGGFSFNAQRTDVGTKIKITPHINDENQVRLEIEEEISETGAPSGALGAVSITQRTARTTVVVDDQQTVVIGGLMRDTKEQGRQKVPILGDLPVLGFLFRNSTERIRKTNLLLILTPHVIRDQRDLRQVFQRKMQERQQFLDRYFVFTSDWEPPRDFTRTNGLVEDIRQAFVTLEERERIKRESERSEERFHEASEALELAGSLKGDQKKAAPLPRKKATPKRKTAPKRSTVRSRKSSQLDEPPLNIQPFARSVNVEEPPPGPHPADEGPVTVDRVE